MNDVILNWKKLKRFIKSDKTDNSINGKDRGYTHEEIQYNYNCYECVKVNHGSPLYQTNSKSDYERHVINKHPRGLCYPNHVDIDLRGYIAQDREWEK